MLRRDKLLPIDVDRTWTARHSHHHLRVAEALDGRIWLRLEDLQQWVPGLAKGPALAERHPGMVRVIKPSNDPYLEASTFKWITQKSSNVSTLKLRNWLEATILEPARKRHHWQDYRPAQATAIAPSLLSADVTDRAAHLLDAGKTRNELDRAAGTLRGHCVARWLDPRQWSLAQGRWGLKTVLAVGAAGSLLALTLAEAVDAKAFNVNNNYLVWTWLAIALSAWAVLFNLAWMVGSVRSGIRRSGDGFNPWLTTLLVAVNLAAAALIFNSTAKNTQELVRVWWAIYVDGDPPVVVTVDERHADGSGKRLHLTGPIGIGSTRALREAVVQNPEASELVLSSPGGLVIEGFGLANVVRSSGLKSTLVLESCASACTLPFVMGEHRAVARDASIGFHRSYSIFGDFGTGWGPTEHRMAELLRLRGVSERFIERAFSVPGWDLYEAPRDELVREGVATDML